MERFSIYDAAALYGVNEWGAGFFDINKEGHLIVKPMKDDTHRVDLKDVVDMLAKRKVEFPILLRFPQMLSTRVKEFHENFQRAREEFNYQGEHLGVFPMKVNQQRIVIEELIRAGKKQNYGLEVGSKSELLAAIINDTPENSLILCNGYKDDAYISLALCGLKIGKKIIITIEHSSELEQILKKAEEWKVKPLIGARLKLHARGSGKWETSGGVFAKFGLTSTEFVQVVNRLKEKNCLDSLVLLHFHLGSQITQIKRIKNFIREGARYYAKACKMGLNIKYLDVGGGLGVDYDGSKSSADSSSNYNMQEYANDVVYIVNEVCDVEDVDPPCIVTESGRAIASYHSMLVMSAWRNLSKPPQQIPELLPKDAQVISELHGTLTAMNAKNYREYYHDATQQRDEMYALFDLGYLSIEERAKGEQLFSLICKKALQYAHNAKVFPEEFEELEKTIANKYLCGFSVFQSAPDSWALEQLFPLMPIARLDEKPTARATLVDLTCDSDGEIKRFVHVSDVKPTIELHELREGEPYYLALLFLGAYQEVIGDFHNLLGSVNEAHIFVDDENEVHIDRIIKGNTVDDMLRYCQYDLEEIRVNVENMVKRASEKLNLQPKEAQKIVDELNRGTKSYTYAK